VMNEQCELIYKTGPVFCCWKLSLAAWMLARQRASGLESSRPKDTPSEVVNLRVLNDYNKDNEVLRKGSAGVVRKFEEGRAAIRAVVGKPDRAGQRRLKLRVNSKARQAALVGLLSYQSICGRCETRKAAMQTE